ncbi:hypothetical protein IGI71_003315 [Enterococcus sp. DIV1279b]|uniref:FtsK/SpoIIIE domain-containing protein n=1 Tax=Enterococcus sp. DIV1279b TaxID=2774663 RepID=UPI00324F1F33
MNKDVWINKFITRIKKENEYGKLYIVSLKKLYKSRISIRHFFTPSRALIAFVFIVGSLHILKDSHGSNGIMLLMLCILIILLLYIKSKFFPKYRPFEPILRSYIFQNDLYEEKNGQLLSEIRMAYIEDLDVLRVIIEKNGDRYQKIANQLGESLESKLSMQLYETNETINYVEYIFLKEAINIEQSIFTSSSIEKETFNNIPIETIMLTSKQGFSLKSNTNLGLYGRTGAGKTVGLQWYLYNAIAKGSGTDSNSLLSIVDGKGADLYSLGEIISEEIDGNISVGQTPSSLAKLSREFVEAMDLRFELIKESNALNADAYDLGLTPNFLFIDELASIRDSCGSSKQGKELWNEIIQNIGLVARKGRQAGSHLILSTQDPNAENIPVEIRNQISSVLYLGNPSNDRVKMAFSMCELEHVPTLSGRKGEALFYADGLNMTEPEITIVPFVDIKTKQDFRNVVNRIKPNPNNFI